MRRLNLFRVTILVALLSITIPFSASAEQYVCLLPAEAPVQGSQSFECPLPSDIRSIREVRLVATGEFQGTIWLCNLETPDPFSGPGGLSFTVGGDPSADEPRSDWTWLATEGAYDEVFLVPAPDGGDWHFLSDRGQVRVALEHHVPDSWDCYDRCPHGCSNVSGFDGLSGLTLVIEYDRIVSADDRSWGTLKARW